MVGVPWMVSNSSCFRHAQGWSRRRGRTSRSFSGGGSRRRARPPGRRGSAASGTHCSRRRLRTPPGLAPDWRRCLTCYLAARGRQSRVAFYYKKAHPKTSSSNTTSSLCARLLAPCCEDVVWRRRPRDQRKRAASTRPGETCTRRCSLSLSFPVYHRHQCSWHHQR